MEKQITQTPIQSEFMPIVTGIHMQTEFINFAIWYGTPSQFRKPKTQKEFAKSIGVSIDTLTDWKKRPQFSFFVWQATKEWIKERMPDVVGGLYLKASSRKAGANDVKLCLQLAGLEINNNSEKK